MDRLLQDALPATEDLDAVFGLVDAAGVRQFADGDRARRVDAALVDPFLDALEVDGGHIEGEAVGRRIVRHVRSSINHIFTDRTVVKGMGNGRNR